MDLKATGERYLIKRQVEGEVTDGGLVRPDAARKALPCGVVVAVGEGLKEKLRKGEITGPNVGDFVHFPDAAAWDVEIKGEHLTSVYYGDITAWEARQEA